MGPITIGENPKVKVIICDDHIAIRSGLRGILEEAHFNVVAVCETVPALITALSEHQDAVVITDLGVGGLPFQQLLIELRTHVPDCRVIAYSMRETAATIGVCYDAGALAFVPKSADIEEIIKALDTAAAGQQYFPPSVAAELASLHVDKRNPRSLLSDRELALLVSYVENDNIEVLADRHGLSAKTVQNTLSMISKKLGIARTSFHKLVQDYGLRECAAGSGEELMHRR